MLPRLPCRSGAAFAAAAAASCAAAQLLLAFKQLRVRLHCSVLPCTPPIALVSSSVKCCSQCKHMAGCSAGMTGGTAATAADQPLTAASKASRVGCSSWGLFCCCFCRVLLSSCGPEPPAAAQQCAKLVKHTIMLDLVQPCCTTSDVNKMQDHQMACPVSGGAIKGLQHTLCHHHHLQIVILFNNSCNSHH